MHFGYQTIFCLLQGRKGYPCTIIYSNYAIPHDCYNKNIIMNKQFSSILDHCAIFHIVFATVSLNTNASSFWSTKIEAFFNVRLCDTLLWKYDINAARKRDSVINRPH